MKPLLFAYGTLLQNHAPAEIAAVVSQLRPAGKATARGHLYDLGSFPGAHFQADSNDEVHGEVFELENTALLKALDEYEEFDPERPEKSLFVRKKFAVRMDESGKTVDCWVYEYNGSLSKAQRLNHGRYARHAKYA